MTRFYSEIYNDMAAIEASQNRSVRALALDPTDAIARQFLAETEAKIVVLRAELRAAQGASTTE